MSQLELIASNLSNTGRKNTITRLWYREYVNYLKWFINKFLLKFIFIGLVHIPFSSHKGVFFIVGLRNIFILSCFTLLAIPHSKLSTTTDIPSKCGISASKRYLRLCKLSFALKKRKAKRNLPNFIADSSTKYISM